MEIYLDTGNLEEIKEVVKTGLINGVTTNPTLISRENLKFETIIKNIVKIFKEEKIENFTVSAEVTKTNSVSAMIKEAKALSSIDKHVLIKVPLTKKGLLVVKELSKLGIRTNVTLCFSANQAFLAAKAGAWCVSPFIGRIDDEGYDGLEVVKDIKEIFEKNNIKTKILAASIRHPQHFLEVSKLGVDIITLPYKVFELLYYNPLTDKGLEKFNEDWKNFNKKMKNGRKI